jgi:hypothetical protein
VDVGRCFSFVYLLEFGKGCRQGADESVLKYGEDKLGYSARMMQIQIYPLKVKFS